ncbi:MAG: helix-turn-helix transcriptional regulator [Phycisphaeraceae bacterium]|nr:helix-turn-helix transcriptional regulator [Phycisphaeraceae bacterium]MCB9848319.1 helix-turn-helix transcriptional regulator [Phycisphaeraceae bacterium]
MIDASRTSNSDEFGGCALPPGSASTLWQALCNDTAAFILIIDESGVVRCCNDLVNEQVGAEHAPLEGKTVATFCSEGVAEECADMVRRCIVEDRAVNLIGMCKGVASRSIARPLPAVPGERRCALKVVRPLNEYDALEQQRGEGVWMTATSFDLGRLSDLTSREMEVLRLIGESMTTAEIAERLHRSVKTIEWHRVSLGSKLGAANRVELARIAASAGLQHLDEETFAKICRLSAAEQAVHPF